MDDIDNLQAEAVDKFLNASYGLWNALLTVNGIILATFSAIYVVNPGNNIFLIKFIVWATILSSALLVLNYLMRRHTYYQMVIRLSLRSVTLTPEEKLMDHKDAVLRHKIGYYGENLSLGLFILEISAIAWFL